MEGLILHITVKTILALVLAAFLAVLSVYQFTDVPDGNRELRLPASAFLRAIDSKDYGLPIENEGNGSQVWAIRSTADKSFLAPELGSAVQFILDLPGLVAKSLEKGAVEQDNPVLATAQKPHLLAPILDQDGFGLPDLLAALPHDFKDALDSRGHPVRWQTPENLIAGYSRLRPRQLLREEVVKTETARIPAIPRSERMEYYRGLVENFSRRYNLNTNLVMAIIHSESDFSPALVSNKSAMGLMQLLPSTASDEVHRFLYGRRGQIGFEDLRNPEINIRYGTAYLHILLNRYFANVHNRDVREVCAIASYNLGPNRFLRLYGSTNEQAVDRINRMSEDEFYEDLIKRLPARETRFFVQKVRRMKQHYSSLP